jgi:YHS domain-containing protein
MKLLKTFAITAALLSPTVMAAPAFADSAPIYTPLRNSIAVGGYDTVSYFSGKPMKGDKRYTTKHLGVTWRFSTRANLDLFKANPNAFIPQYGGYCAWALAHGKLAKASPKQWLVEDGKLYLNFNARIQTQWLADKDEFIVEADKRWPDILRD